MDKTYQLFRNIIASKAFLYLTFVWFTFQSAWMAFSNRFDIPHDEQYHFNIIRIYGDNWLPFLSSQPPLENIGDVTRLTSYLYHYLLSFPYRIIELFTDDFKTQLLSLRFLNIAIAITSLIVLYLILKQLTKSKAVINIIIFMTANTTVFTFISGGVNYDNLLFLVILLTYYLLLRFIKAKPNINNLLLLMLIVFVGMLTKFAYLPIAVAVALYAIYEVIRNREAWLKELNKYTKNLKSFSKVILLLAVLVFGLLMVERYVYNTVKYRTFKPDCLQVQSEEVCLSNRPYARNLALEAVRDQKETTGISNYTEHWVSETRLRTFGIYSGISTKTDFTFVATFTVIMMTVTLFTLVENFKSVILKNKGLLVILIASSVYLLALYSRNVSIYYKFAEPLAIQGRYVIPIMSFVYLTSILLFLKTFKSKLLRTIVIILTLITFLITGLVTYVTLSDQRWWFDSENIESLNLDAKDILSPAQKLR